ncbi:MAG: hypothetical protein JWP13_721, partial [Candidatus Saccharibacteria bacterium]|nr:hypothetical protein [Candidatus Saccharibacteria bacterium]
MAIKNNKQDEETPDLEKKIDQIMDPKLPDPAPTDSVGKMAGAPKVPDIDIFKDNDPIEVTVNKEEKAKEATELTPEPSPPGTTDTPEQGASEPEVKIIENASVDTPEVDPLVDDIVAREGDELLEAQDAEIAKAFDNKPETFRERLKNFFAAWWQNKAARYLTLTVLALAIVMAGVVPGSRYFVLNTTGVRAGASLSVLDSTTDLPL